jgi:hypothetical protein
MHMVTQRRMPGRFDDVCVGEFYRWLPLGVELPPVPPLPCAPVALPLAAAGAFAPPVDPVAAPPAPLCAAAPPLLPGVPAVPDAAPPAERSAVPALAAPVAPEFVSVLF